MSATESSSLVAQDHEVSISSERSNSPTSIESHQELVKKIRFQNIIITALALWAISFLIYFVYQFKKTKKLKEENKVKESKINSLTENRSKFFANISHDLRSPITLIQGGIHQVLASPEVFLSKKAERALRISQVNCDRIAHMTNEINELAELEGGKLELRKSYIHVGEIIQLFQETFNRIAHQKGINITFTNESFDDPIILVDPLYFEKVIFNLITNAIKYTDSEGNIHLRLTQVDSQLIISITDTGKGIDPEKLPHVFDRYYQVPDKSFKTKEGIGVGLALAREIVERHGAVIEAYSEVGKGSTFAIIIDLERDRKEQELYQINELEYSNKNSELYRNIDDQMIDHEAIVHINTTAKTGKEKTVLIVEDHPEVREYLELILSSLYNVIAVSDGVKALKLLQKETVDLIITDLMMPLMDGFELLERIKNDDKLRKLPVLVMSALTSDKNKQAVLDKGVNDFLCKPFKPDELLKRSENLLDMKSMWGGENGDLLIASKETLDDVEKSQLKKVEQLIVDHVDDPNLSVAFLAGEVAVSERKFYRLVKKLTGTTPFEYIKEIRLQMAMKLIKEKNIQSSSEVAKTVGINNVTHFNSQFKKRFGKRPSEFI